jgi:hypothetical protein
VAEPLKPATKRAKRGVSEEAGVPAKRVVALPVEGALSRATHVAF